MPIYEYRCEACGRVHDVLQKVSDSPLKTCPACKKRRLKRLMSAPRFRLKGAGWYETDFKSDGEKKRNLAESGGDKDMPASADGGDSKGSAKDGAKEAAKDGGKESAKEGGKGSAGDSAKPSASGREKSGAATGARAGGKSSARRARTANLATARGKKRKTPRR